MERKVTYFKNGLLRLKFNNELFNFNEKIDYKIKLKISNIEFKENEMFFKFDCGYFSLKSEKQIQPGNESIFILNFDELIFKDECKINTFDFIDNFFVIILVTKKTIFNISLKSINGFFNDEGIFDISLCHYLEKEKPFFISEEGRFFYKNTNEEFFFINDYKIIKSNTNYHTYKEGVKYFVKRENAQIYLDGLMKKKEGEELMIFLNNLKQIKEKYNFNSESIINQIEEKIKELNEKI